MAAKSSKRVLVTGFTPFAGEATNPSWEIVRALPDVMSGRQATVSGRMAMVHPFW